MADNNENVEIRLTGKFENGQYVINAVKTLQKNLDDVGKSVDQTEKKTNILTDTLKRLAAIVGITALANQFKNLVKGSLEAAGAMEQVDIALTTMLGSAEKSKKLTQDLIAFAKVTPFQIEGIFQSAKQLMAFGVAAEEILPTMNTLGNIAAGVGVDMNRLALVFGQVKATGHLMGQDLNQFTQAGIPLLEVLGKVLGKTSAEVQVLKENGQISFAAVKVALESMTAEGGKFYNLMQNQSKTFLGTISNMSDSFFQVKTALGDALLPVAKQVVASMIIWFGNLKTIIENNKESISSFASVIVSAFSLIGSALKLVFNLITNFISGLKVILSFPLVNWIVGVTVAVLAFSKGLGLLTIAIRVFTATALGWISVIIAAVTAIGYLSKGIDNMPEFVKTAVLQASKAFELLKVAIFDFVEEVLDKLSVLSDLPFFGWVDDAKKKFEDLKNSSIKNIDDINKTLEQIKSPELGTINAPSGEVAPVKQDVQQNLLIAEDPGKAEQRRLKALKEENEALLEEQKNFLAGYGLNETEADRLIAENKTLSLQQRILQNEEYAAKKNSLDQQLLADEISNEQYKAELLALNNEAKNEALQVQFETELANFQMQQETKNALELEMQTTHDEAKFAQLQLQLNQTDAAIQASETKQVAIKSQAINKTFEQKKAAKEKDLQHSLKMDSDGYKAAQGAANELVALQNSKNKQLAAIGKAAAIFQITNDTARGAMSAYASLSPIPFVGPALGAAAAAAIIAYGAERISQVGSNSFAVGTPNIPQDQMAMVHQGEMIVPASFSDAIRSGDLTLGGANNTLDSLNDNNQDSITNVFNINFEGANFYGKMDDEEIKSIGIRLSQLISEDIIPAIPTRTA